MMNYDFESEEEGRESSAVEHAMKKYGIRVVKYVNWSSEHVSETCIGSRNNDEIINL